MGWSHRYRRAYWGTLLSIIEQPRFESRCMQVRDGLVVRGYQRPALHCSRPMEDPCLPKCVYSRYTTYGM
jgi:hypothetical protein